MHVAHEDGTAQDIGPGNAYVIEPGVGYEFDLQTAEEYAKGG